MQNFFHAANPSSQGIDKYSQSMSYGYSILPGLLIVVAAPPYGAITADTGSGARIA
jgi:hypothetical protein